MSFLSSASGRAFTSICAGRQCGIRRLLSCTIQDSYLTHAVAGGANWRALPSPQCEPLPWWVRTLLYGFPMASSHFHDAGLCGGRELRHSAYHCQTHTVAWLLLRFFSFCADLMLGGCELRNNSYYVCLGWQVPVPVPILFLLQQIGTADVGVLEAVLLTLMSLKT